MKFVNTIKHCIYFFFLVISYTNVAAQEKKYQFIGNPHLKHYSSGEKIYARNIWDMQVFDNKIYLGAGNSSNRGPAQNAGRVPLIYYDLKTEEFVNEYKIAEEQIDVFKVIDNKLFIPGHDATQKWTFGNIYSKKSGKEWKKHRTLPNALHIYDLIKYNNKLFAAVGLKGKGAVFVSDDNAKTWKSYPHGSGRVYSLFNLDGEIFSARTFKKKKPEKVSVTQWQDGKFLLRRDIKIKTIFPNTRLSQSSTKITRTISTGKYTYYLGTYKHNDHQSKPFGAYFAYLKNNKIHTSKLILDRNYVPRDILVRGDRVDILVNNTDTNRTKVLRFNVGSNNKEKEMISFKYPAFARSFEEFQGCYYFGMGSDLKSSSKWKLNEIKPQTGDILKSCINEKL